MKTPNQLNWVKNRLRNDGYVTRNEALKVFITCLGALVNKLNNEGWEIEGNNIKTEHGKDYKYTLVSAPKQVKYVFVDLPDGSRIAKPTYV